MPDPVQSGSPAASVQSICAEFADRWQAGEVDGVESYLSGREDSLNLDRAKVLCRLIQQEINLRRQSGEFPRESDYVARFPDISDEQIVELLSLPAPPPVEFNTPLLPSRYRPVKEVGRGGIGRVWRVHDRHLDRPLAVKVLHERYRSDSAAIARLNREALLTGMLQHPGIPPVHDKGELVTGSPFFCMKLVVGETLNQLLGRRRRSTEDRAKFIGIFEQVAQTIAYSHSQNIIHRDLKPHNIMVGEFGEVQIMDWGMAKQIGRALDDSDLPAAYGTGATVVPPSNAYETAAVAVDSSYEGRSPAETRQGDVLGTPAYMSPEQARGDHSEVSKASDVYALGAILFEILSNERWYDFSRSEAFVGDSRPSDRDEITERLECRDIDSALVELCETCLRNNPADRLKAEEVAHAVDQYQVEVQNRLKQAEIARESALIHSQEQRKRTRIVVGMSAAIAVVCLLGVAGIAWQWNKTSTALKRAARESETRKEVNDFLIIDMLRQADPGVEPDRDLKLRTVLDRAARKIPIRFRDRPDIEAEIRLQIGQSYSGLGEYEIAKQHFDEAARINRDLFGDDSDEYWLVYQELAKTEHDLGNYQVAMDMLERLESRNERIFGTDSTPAITSRSAIASCLMMLGDTRAAANLQRQVLDSLVDCDDPSLINSNRTKLAHMEFQLSRYDEAESLIKTAMESMDRETALDADVTPLEGNIDYIQALSTIALIQDARGEFAESESTQRECLEMATQLLGPDHARRLQLANNLAISLLNQNKIEDAEKLLAEVVPAMEGAVGSEHDITLSALNTLAGLYYSKEDYENAEITFLKARQGLLKKFDPPHQALLTNSNNLAGLFLSTDRLEKAEEWFKRSCEESIELYGRQHRYSITSLANLALTHRKLGKTDEAESEYREAVDLATECFSSDHPDTLHYKRGLAFLYETTERSHLAEPLLRDVIEAYEKHFGPDHESSIPLKNRLAFALLQQDRIAESLPYYDEVYEFQRKNRGETDAKTLSVFWALIRTEERAGRLATVRSRLQKLRNALDPAADQWVLLRVRARLGNVLGEMGAFNEAEFLLLDSYEKLQTMPGPSEKVHRKELQQTVAALVSMYQQLQDFTSADVWETRGKSLADLPASDPRPNQ